VYELDNDTKGIREALVLWQPLKLEGCTSLRMIPQEICQCQLDIDE
jgi:hypothetical protein